MIVFSCNPVSVKFLLLLLFFVIAGIHTTLVVMAINPLEIKYTKFFDSITKKEVILRGVDYYPRPNTGKILNHNSIDYFTDEYTHIWERDIAYLKLLGVNAIRLYAVDPTKNHDSFMCKLAEEDIYVIIPLAHDCPTCAITKDQAPDCYPSELKQQGIDIIYEFSRYDNVLGFSSGNEVNHYTPLNQPEWNAPCQKKFIADMRQYIDHCTTHNGMRKIPVGLVVADTDRYDNAMYYNCEEREDDNYDEYDDKYNKTNQLRTNKVTKDEIQNDLTHAEFYGLNTYVACNGTAHAYDELLGLKSLQQDFALFQYSIPVLLTEFGCLSDTYPTIDGYQGQRTFLEAKYLSERPELRQVFAGSFAFEYSMEYENAHHQSPYPFQTFGKQNYGLGYFEPENCNDIDIPCHYTPLPCFDNLRKAYTQSYVANLVTNMNNFTVPIERQQRSKCPSRFPPLSSFHWEADTNVSMGKCPSKWASSFTCLASVRVINQKYKPGMIVSVIFATLIILIVAFLSFRHRKKEGYEEIDGME